MWFYVGSRFLGILFYFFFEGFIEESFFVIFVVYFFFYYGCRVFVRLVGFWGLGFGWGRVGDWFGWGDF